MSLRKLKYPALILMLHVLFASCNIRHEVARITHQSSGCFHYVESELTIYKEGGRLIAALEEQGLPMHMKQLNDKQLKYFNSFIGELIKREQGGGCTTWENYRVYMNGTTLGFSDGSCDWDGFDKLRENIFGVPLTRIIPP
jgi:hypothetical protein